MASTALQLTNRCLRKLGKEDVAGFSTSDRSQLVIDTINETAREILTEEGWDFLRHHDGVIQIPAPVEGVTGTWVDWNEIDVPLTNASQAGILDAIDSTDDLASRFQHRFVCHILISNSPTAPDTSFRVSRVQQRTGTATLAGTYRFRLEGRGAQPPTLLQAFDAGIVPTSTVTVFCPEVVFPPQSGGIVAQVISARYQEEDIEIRGIDGAMTFERYVPRPHESIGTEPEVMAVGGTAYPTLGDFSQVSGDNETASPDAAFTAREYWGTEAGLRAMLWPIPSSALETYTSTAVAPYRKVDFSYLFVPAPLALVTDRWEGIPESILDQIVNRAAAAIQVDTTEADPELGVMKRRMSDSALARMAQRHKPDIARRKAMRSLDRIGRRNRFNLPKNFGEL